jgi:hypothetical protein
VLAGEPLVGCHEKNVIEGLTEVVAILIVIEMQEERLPAPGRHPVRKLVEVAGADLRVLDIRPVLIATRGEGVDVRRERFGVRLEPVKVMLGLQPGEVLEILPGDRLGATGVDGAGMLTDVLVVADEIGVVHTDTLLGLQRLHQVGHPAWSEPLLRGAQCLVILTDGLGVLWIPHAEELPKVGGQDEPLLKLVKRLGGHGL